MLAAFLDLNYDLSNPRSRITGGESPLPVARVAAASAPESTVLGMPVAKAKPNSSFRAEPAGTSAVSSANPLTLARTSSGSSAGGTQTTAATAASLVDPFPTRP